MPALLFFYTHYHGRICGDTFGKGGFDFHYGGLKKYKKSVETTPTLIHEFRAARKKFIELKMSNPNVHLSKACDALTPPRIILAQRGEVDEVCPPQEEFLELWKYEKLYGEADPKIVKEQAFRGKIMQGVWTIPESEQGKYTRSRKSQKSILESTTVCELESSEDQAEKTFTTLFEDTVVLSSSGTLTTGQPAKAKAKPGKFAKPAQLALPVASVELWSRRLIEAAVSTWTEKSEDVKVEIRTGQGKKSSAEVAAGDIKFMLEVTSALNTKVADMTGMPESNEDDLASFCREKCDTALFVGMFPVIVIVGMFPVIVSCHSIGCCVFYFVCLQVVKFKFVLT
jgi:hypothetical protein